MATAIELLNQRQDENWLQGWDAQGRLRPQLTAPRLATAAHRAKTWLEQQDWSKLNHLGQTQSAKASADPNRSPSLEQSRFENHECCQRELTLVQPVVLLAISDPAQFLAWFSAISSLGYPLFLGDPAWGLKHWQQVDEGLHPDLVIIDPERELPGNFHRMPWPVENSIFLWEKRDFPQILSACGKRIDPNDHRNLKHFGPYLDYPQAVEKQWIGIPTGGSSGLLRFAMHRWNTLTASVSGLQQSQLTGEDGVINSCCTLPLHHVSGLMQFLRSLLSGGQIRILPWSLVKDHFHLGEHKSRPRQNDTSLQSSTFLFDQEKFFLSLVPTQLQRLLTSDRATAWLACFNTVLLGGAPAWSALLERSRAASIRLAPTYGMTETASQIITLHPDDFIQGKSGCGKLLPHAQIHWVSATAEAIRTIAGKTSSSQAFATQGLIKISARSLAWGYYSIAARAAPTVGYVGQLELWSDPPGAGDRALLTDDLGYCDDEGYFYVIGRASNKIISGGENVFPAAVEAAILATGLVEDAVVLGIADAQWGQRVVAVVATQPALAAANQTSSSEPLALAPRELSEALIGELTAAIAPALSPAQRPKQWLVTQAIPRSAQGKIHRRSLADWVISQG